MKDEAQKGSQTLPEPSLRLGIDIGSTTLKAVVTDGDGGAPLFTAYRRHHADMGQALAQTLADAERACGNRPMAVGITGSVGMGLAERLGLAFVQEVVAATVYVKRFHPNVRCMIDIGGEDAKIVCMEAGAVTDFRMNGNCAGGTGAFIDQMAVLMGVTPEGLDALAAQATHTYDIASRCGVFSKTDVQNLVGLGAAKEDIAASVFHAVAVQTVGTLSHGCTLQAPILVCGGPLTFMPSLRKAMADCLKMTEGEDFVLPPHSELVPAYGTALACRPEALLTPRELADMAAALKTETGNRATGALPPLFADGGAAERWRADKRTSAGRLAEIPNEIFLGIDSGSTTTKIVATDGAGHMAFSHYCPNRGNPIGAVAEGLQALVATAGRDVTVCGSCATGYGEDLIRAAFGLDGGTIETIAHYMAARHVDPDVSFVLDIGGQDMKAIFVEEGAVTRMELNEACSSGCGSFIETFAHTLGFSVEEFARMACDARHPADLGTRCTVFMNSKVKQVLREGAEVADIAAGLAYSVAKNCLYKVLKLTHTDELGQHIVVQGGTMRNDAVVRAFELLTGAQVSRSDCPELMGAYGCALLAAGRQKHGTTRLSALARTPEHTTRTLRCHGCENACTVRQYRFGNGATFHSGNKCERVFHNGGTARTPGQNGCTEKARLLFDRPTNAAPRGRIGLPRVLNMYEEYPFWHALLQTAGYEPVLSAPSNFGAYERAACAVMSDNICFPAKLVHSHINDLLARGVDRILMPYVVYEKMTPGVQNSYNCPIVTGYSDVVKSVTNTAVPIDAPTFSFKDPDGLRRQCRDYLATLGVDKATAARAFSAAVRAQEQFERDVCLANRQILDGAKQRREPAILLAGRPYHTDPLIQHKLADTIAAMGVNVVTDDIVRLDRDTDRTDTHLVQQWAYTNRILRAATFAARQDSGVELVQMTSFGCGPDAFLTDEVRDIMGRAHKPATLLKVDDVNNIGSLKLRVRSLIESLRLRPQAQGEMADVPFTTTAPFGKTDSRRKILIPHFTPFISPLIPDVLAAIGYEAETLPLSDEASAETGLRHANNEVCYPATLIVGDIMKALQSGRYDLDKTAVAITLTGGQCRATNYVALIRKALTDAGLGHVPVITVGFDSLDTNPQPGFSIPWLKVLPLALATILYTDCLAKFYYATLARETVPGQARQLLNAYTEAAHLPIRQGRTSALYSLIGEAARDFDRAATTERHLPQVGVVGEIFLKFNTFAHRHIVDDMAAHGVEILPPQLLPFFTQGFVNRKVRHETHVERGGAPSFVADAAYRLVVRCIRRADRQAAAFRHYRPVGDIFHEARIASRIVNLSAQFGEGWGLPAEIAAFAEAGVCNVVSLQPFGCIANHIVAKGIERRLKQLYPSLNLLALDFDGGVSDVNVRNRLLLFTDNLQPARP